MLDHLQDSIYNLRVGAFIERVEAAVAGGTDEASGSDCSARHTRRHCKGSSHRGPVSVSDVTAIGTMLCGIYSREHKCW